MSLAVATGVPAREWIDEGERAIQTASLILKEQEKASKGKGGSGEQMSG